MQETEFEKRWAAIYEWVAFPRVIVSTDEHRLVARRADVEKRQPVEIVAEMQGADALGASRWEGRGAPIVVVGYEANPSSHAWLALIERAREEMLRADLLGGNDA